MAQLNGWVRTNRFAAFLTTGILAVLVLGAAYIGIAKATDKPSFCGAACHEMGPYHDAWATGPHKDISCVECHVDQNEVAKLMHKVEAMKEVASHVKGDTLFPRPEPAVVPDARCIRCHETIDPKIPGFNHATHSKDKPCQQCHADAGHTVTPTALLQAGVLNTETASQTVSAETTKAVVDAGKADLVAHKPVSCSRCHVMSKTPCSSCHTPKHKPRGECSTCHKPAVKFAFSHPLGGVDCASCHKVPAKHTADKDCVKCHTSPGKDWKYVHVQGVACDSCHARPEKHRAGACASCHKDAGKTWAFAHPAAASACTSCHKRPAGHRAGSCTSCHRNTGTNWAFAHPSSRSACTSCHNRPGGHKAGQCSSCHQKTGRSWAFAHPGTGSRCSSCHNRPGGHKSGQCSSCHKKPGRSWAFAHPGTGSNCSGCHNRPSGHSSGQCSNCHRRPGRSWAYTHARIPGGEHSSRSFACRSCHPSGYRSHTCSKCHDSASGGDD